MGLNLGTREFQSVHLAPDVHELHAGTTSHLTPVCKEPSGVAEERIRGCERLSCLRVLDRVKHAECFASGVLRASGTPKLKAAVVASVRWFQGELLDLLCVTH